jgi:hypothetical protein
MNDALAARAAGRDGPFGPTGAAGVSLGAYQRCHPPGQCTGVRRGQPAVGSVRGEAHVNSDLRLLVDASPLLQATFNKIQNMDFSIPLGSAPTGRMDADAAPRRSGIGHM